MSAIDERLVVLRLYKNWCGRVERGELDVQHGWPLLLKSLRTSFGPVMCAASGRAATLDIAAVQEAFDGWTGTHH